METYDTARLAALGKTRRRLTRELEENRQAITPEVVAARQAGVRQADVVALSGYTREQVRRIERANGIDADS